MANKKALDLDQLKTSLSAVKDWTNDKIAALTKDDVGLDKVDNTADADKAVKSAVQDTDGDKFTEKYLKNRGAITDFNAATAEGVYIFNGTVSNFALASGYGSLSVFVDGSVIIQVASVTNSARCYRRKYETATGWGDWYTVAYTSDIPTVPTATDSKAGIMKLYTSTGSSTDGTMTRKAITDSLIATKIAYGTGNSAGSVPPVYAGITGTAKNIFRYLPPDAIYIEYSADGGTTWTEYTDSNAATNKLRLTDHINDLNHTYYFGGPDSTTTITTDYKLRFTFSPTDGRYGDIKFFYIYLSASRHNISCDVERSTIGAKTTFTKTLSDVHVAGWSGPNIINMSGGVAQFGGGDNQTTNGYSVRFTFNIAQINADYSSNVPFIQNIRAYADPIWNSAGITYLNTGLDYNIDTSKNITFPANITATQLNGRATDAIALSDSSGKYNVGDTETPVYFKDGKPVATTLDSLFEEKADKDTVLLKDNTTEYTPTADYNPSTKKYVDDNITGIDKVFTGATSSADGAKGLVPAPAKGNQDKYLKGNGTWGTPYTHPTTAGNKHIPSGGASGNILKWSANGTAVWGDPDSTDPCYIINATDPSTMTDPKIEFNDTTIQTSGYNKLKQFFSTYGFNIAIMTESGYIFKLSYFNADNAICIFNGLIDKKADIASGSITSKVIGTITCIGTTWSYAEKDVGDSGVIVSASTTVANYSGDRTIVNPLSEPISDSAQIYQNGILLQKDVNYTINDQGDIQTIDYDPSNGDVFTVISKTTGVDVQLNATASNITLTNSNGYFDNVSDVENAIQKIGAKLNGGVVSSIKVNGTAVTPDSDGSINVPSPTIKVNGTTVAAATDGSVNITNVVKTTGATMTGDLVAKSTSTGNHVRNIAVYASDATLPTTGNDGDIILVYSNS